MENATQNPVLTYKPEFVSAERKAKTGKFIIFDGDKYVGEVNSEALAKLICEASQLLDSLKLIEGELDGQPIKNLTDHDLGIIYLTTPKEVNG